MKVDYSQFPIFPYDRRDQALCITGSHLGRVSKLLRERGVVFLTLIQDGWP